MASATQSGVDAERRDVLKTIAAGTVAAAFGPSVFGTGTASAAGGPPLAEAGRPVSP